MQGRVHHVVRPHHTINRVEFAVNKTNQQLMRHACDGLLRHHDASCRANAMALRTTIPELIGKGFVGIDAL